MANVRRLLPALTLLIAASLVVSAAPEEATDLGDDLRAQLEGAVRARIGELLDDKNEDGLSYKRGSFSKRFIKVADNTYQVGFHQDTALEDRVKTERLTLTLTKGEGGWKITDEKLEDTYEGLFRLVVGDEKLMTFDELQLDREGLKVTGRNGVLMLDYYRGEPSGFIVHADDLRFELTPPREAISQYESVLHYFKKRSVKDFHFDPRHMTVVCDAQSCGEIMADSFTNLSEVEVAPGELDGWYKSIRNAWRKRLKENPFAFFRTPNEPDRKRYWVLLNRSGDDPLLGVKDFSFPESHDHNLWMYFDSYAPKEVNLYTTRIDGTIAFYRPFLSYYSEATRESGVDPYELELRPDGDAHDYEVVSVSGETDLGIGDPELLVGDVTVTLKAKRDLDYLRFFIANRREPGSREEIRNPTMFVNSLTDAEGRELTWVRAGGSSAVAIPRETIKAGEEYSVRLQFQTKGSIFKLNPTFSYVSRGGWLPFVRFADMVHGFDLTVRVPSKYRVLGIGTKLEDKVIGDVRQTRWTANHPVTFLSMTYGEYIDTESETVATKIDGTEIPVRVYVDKTSTNTVSFDQISSLSEAEQEVAAYNAGARGIRGKQLQSIAEQAAASINLFREVFGVDYPFGKLDLVADPVGPLFYGQAPSSLIYLGSRVFRGEAESATRGGGTQIAKFLKSVVSHEVGHQWWGSSTVNNSSNNYWFVESLAEFASALYLEAGYGPKEYQEQVDEWRANILNVDMTTSVQDAAVLASPDFGNYVANVYNKGPYAFHILRMMYGDEKLKVFLKDLAQELAGKEIATRDIQRVMEQSYGMKMDWFFDQWLRGVGIPEFEFTYDFRRTEDGNWLVQGKVNQTVVIGNQKHPVAGEYYLGAVPVTITARKSKKEYKCLVAVREEVNPFACKVPEEPLEVAFNKYHEILAHDVKVK